MTRLTKYEKETIILFNEGEDRAKIYTYNAGLRKRLATFSKKYPDLCRLEKNCEQGGVTYILDKSRLSIRLQAPYSEERRQKASEYAKKHGLNSQQGYCDNQGWYAVKMSGANLMFWPLPIACEESIGDYKFYGNVRYKVWTGTLYTKFFLPFFRLMKYNRQKIILEVSFSGGSIYGKK